MLSCQKMNLIMRVTILKNYISPFSSKPRKTCPIARQQHFLLQKFDCFLSSVRLKADRFPKNLLTNLRGFISFQQCCCCYKDRNYRESSRMSMSRNALFQEFSRTVVHQFQNRVYCNSCKQLLLETSRFSSDTYISGSPLSQLSLLGFGTSFPVCDSQVILCDK